MQRQERGGGQGSGAGFGTGRGKGRGCGGMGAAGFCICPKCGERFPHQRGVPCLDERCQACGVALVREGSAHHLEIQRRRASKGTEATPAGWMPGDPVLRPGPGLVGNVWKE